MSVPQPTVFANGPNAVTGDQLNSFVQTVLTANQLRTLTGVTGMQISLQGITTPNDGLGGDFYWNSAATAADDNLNTIVPVGSGAGAWLRLQEPGGGGGGGGVTSVLGNTGAVTLAQLVTGGLAPLNSPIFLGNPQGPTPVLSDSSDSFATTNYVTNKIASATAGVSSVVGNSGAVTLAQLAAGGVATTAAVLADFATPPTTGYGNTTAAPVAATTLSATSNASTGVFSITANLTPVTTVTPVINVNESFSGTVTSTNFPGWNEIGISGDSVAFPNGTGTSALFVAEELGGTTMTGNRNALNAFIDVLSKTGNAATGKTFFYTALAGFAETSVNDGGTSAAPYGNLFGGNTSAELLTGATFWNQVVSLETDVGLQSGANVLDLVGVQSIMLSDSAGSPSRTSAAYVVGMQFGGTATGFGVGLQFGVNYGWWPISPGGSLIAAVASGHGGPAMKAAYGIQLNNVTFTTAAIVTTGFEVDGSGNVFANGIAVGNPTGGNMGVGTLNATGIFINGTTGISITGTTLVAPSGLQITQSAGHSLLTIPSVANAANQVSVTAAVANGSGGQGPIVSATGTDTNINLNLVPKGTGVLNLGGTPAATATAGPNGSLPATVAGYLPVLVNGGAAKIPYYNV